MDPVNEEVQTEIEKENGQNDSPARYVVDEEADLVTGK